MATDAKQSPGTAAKTVAKRPSTAPKKSAPIIADGTSPARAEAALTWLKAHATRATRDGMARYAIPSTNAYGVAMRDIKALGKSLGHDQPLARALWTTGVYEARMLASFVGDPAKITAAEMDRWCRDFDNWALCDALSFNLFDRTPHAWRCVEQWSERGAEFEKRTAFALLWALALHDRHSPDAAFLRCLKLIERESRDERNFVKKAVNMALRAYARRSSALRAEARRTAQRLADSDDATARWIGRDALRAL